MDSHRDVHARIPFEHQELYVYLVIDDLDCNVRIFISIKAAFEDLLKILLLDSTKVSFLLFLLSNQLIPCSKP